MSYSDFSGFSKTDPMALSLFIITAFMVAGILYFIWLSLPLAGKFNRPVDGGRHFRGKRIFGENKTFRGFVGMGLAAGISFYIFGSFAGNLPVWIAGGMWDLSPMNYALLGVWCGIGFMAGELPNSFVKRQLQIPPGCAAESRGYCLVFFVVDHMDSLLGALLVMSMVVPVPWKTWVYLLLVGPMIHLGFSALLFLFKGKRRFA